MTRAITVHLESAELFKIAEAFGVDRATALANPGPLLRAVALCAGTFHCREHFTAQRFVQRALELPSPREGSGEGAHPTNSPSPRTPSVGPHPAPTSGGLKLTES